MDQPDDLLQRARTATELLRPHPHRGDLIAAGAAALTVALMLIDLRLDEPWGSGIFLVLEGLAAALVLGMGVLAPMEGERPRAYQVVLHLSGLILLLLALYRLAEVLGADDPLGSAGSVFWILGLVTLMAAWLARNRRSAICALVGSVTGTLAALAFVDWVFDPTGAGTTRWILLLVALGLTAGALVLRDRRRRESVYLIDAAGFAILLLGMTWIGEAVFGAFAFGPDGEAATGPGAGWKAILLAAGLGLLAYAAVDEEAGPGYLGALILLVFVVLVGAPGDGGPSLWFWPAVLFLVGVAMIAAGLRPREPLPPEPTPPGAPAQPVPGPFAGGGGTPRAAGSPVTGSPAPTVSEPSQPAPGATAAASTSRSGGAPDPVAVPDDEAAREATQAVGSPAAPAPADAESPAARGADPEAPASADVDPRAARGADPASADAESPAARGADAAAPPVAPKPPEPEPPARGSLWARADPGEQPTRQQPAVRPPGDDDAPTEARTPRDA